MRKQGNYLDYIPKRNSRYSYQLNEHGNVEIIVKNEGFWNRILQITLKKPRYSMIELEQMGSYVWQEMDGQKTVYEHAWRGKSSETGQNPHVSALVPI